MDNFDYPLILHCEAMKQGESTDNRYEILVAAIADNTHELDQRINLAISLEGYIFLYSEQSLPANKYFSETPQHMADAIGLCQ